MDPISFASQDHFEAEKERFSSFKFGKERPSSASTSTSPSRPCHGRSHSRNLSVSSTVSSSFSFPATTSSIDLSTSPSSPIRSSVSSASKRHSHHRRQSSVSTRRESADVMGVAVPDLPPARSEENVNLGDRDSIRRRALLALEGKSELGAFSSMEIPELKTPEIEKSAFSFPAKPTFSTASGNAFGIGSLTNKRDSFGKSLLSSSSLKEQLGTLLEEEEEEDEAECVSGDVQPTEATAAPLVPAPQETLLPVELPVLPAKTRPAKIRPLALCTTATTPATSITIETGLPSPAPSPSVRAAALKPLTLIHAPLSSGPDFRSQRRSSFGGASRSASYSGHSHTTSARGKRGSLGYKSGDSPPLVAGALPTPEMTPVSERRMSYGSDGTRSTSSSSSSEGVQVLSALTQPLSAAEQHFLYKSHHALLTRIEDLERTLSRRTLRDSRSTSSLSSRTSLSVSTPSSAGGSSIAGPNEDLVQIVADLTAERDELRTDADGWRRRVADGERQTDELRKKLDGERRDAWIARERLAQLDTQNIALQHALDTIRAEVVSVSGERDAVRTERDGLALQLTQALADLAASRADAEAFRTRLNAEVARRERAESELESAGLMSTPTPNSFSTKAHGLGFSIDSQTTEVDGREWEFSLKAVIEEDESRAELGQYKLEQPGDESFSSTDDDDDDDDELEAEHEQEHTVIVASRSPSPLSMDQARDKRYSLSRSWTFPTGKLVNEVKPKDAADRFFACLDDPEDSDASTYSTPFDALARTDERGRELFRSMADESPDEVMFCIPSDVGQVVPEVLEAVVEDDHGDLDDFGGEEVEGGIRFVFGLPPTPPMKPIPAASAFFGDEEEEGDATFTFPQSRLVTSPPTLPAHSPTAAPVRPTPVRPTFIPQPKATSPTQKKASSIPLPSRRATSPSSSPSPRSRAVPTQSTSPGSSSSRMSSPSGSTTNTRLPVYRAAGRRV